jgi:hypothetical protein
MNYCKLQGGLGNQLFQVFNIISYSIDISNEYNFIYASLGYRNTYWDTLFKNLNKYLIYNTPCIDEIINEENFNYNKLNEENKNKNILINGYYQSYKYFNHNFDKIYKIIDIDNCINTLNINYTNTISIHFRIGDYKYFQGNHPLLSEQYYINSINYIIQQTCIDNYNVLYFYENNKEDYDDIINKINNIKLNFPNINFIQRPDNLKDYEELCLMSLCNHNIIANSTFSWWGAYLNKNKNKIVTYPNKWFGTNLNTYNVTDLFPIEWVKINI